MTPKFMQLLEQCVLNGVILGHKRAYKHNDAPNESDINMSIVQEVMNEIHEWFNCDERTGLTMPSKPWQGLTDEDTASICMQSDFYNWHDEQVIDAVEAKLKELNT